MDKCLHIISRDKAIELGIKRYFTGKSCKHGHIDERSVAGSTCLECSRAVARNFNKRPEHKERLLKYRKTNEYKEKAMEYRKRDYVKRADKRHREKQEYKEKRKSYVRNYYLDNKDYLRRKQDEYNNVPENRERRREYIREWARDWSKTPHGSAITAMRSMVRRVMLAAKSEKTCRTFEYLGYSHEDFMAHMESLFQPGMSWDNHGEWHVDHMVPLSWFVSEGITDPAIINALDNLQPLWAEDNLKKGAKNEVSES